MRSGLTQLMTVERRRERKVATAYHLLLGVISWSALLAASFGVLGDALAWPAVKAAEVLSFLLFVVVSRLLAFRSSDTVTVSVDSAFYIAGVLVLGVLPAAWLAAATMTVDTAWRAWRQRGVVPTNARPVSLIIARGGMPAAIVLAVGAMLGALGIEEARLSDTLTVFWVVPLLSVALLIPHFTWMAVGVWLEGHPWRRLLRRTAASMGAELLVLPLSIVIVLVYDRERPLAFILLGITLVLLNVVVKLLATALGRLQARVVELEVLGQVGRAISAHLQLDELIPRIAGETVKLVGRTSKCMIALLDEADSSVAITVFDEFGQQLEEARIPRGEGLTGQVMKSRETLMFGHLQREAKAHGLDDRYNDHATQSWMGTPLVVNDEVIGMLNVQSELPMAYNADQAVVFETIAAQAAVAIENARLYELATVDGLTELYVRRYFDLRLGEEFQLARRHETDFAVLIADLDDFKRINDVHGHQAGDRVLREIARVMRSSIRESDIPCRYGGEEFAVIMPRTSMQEAHPVAERIRDDIAAHRIVADGTVFAVTVSIGLTSFSRSKPGTPEEIVKAADDALYRAKDWGKNRVELGPPDQAPAPRSGTARAG